MTHRPPGIYSGGAAVDNPNDGETNDLSENVEIKVAGRSNLYIADNSQASQPLYYFGEQMDDTPLIFQEFYNDIPGDSNGGSNGPPIDRQVLGRNVRVNFNLSTWNHKIRYMLEQHNGAYEVAGRVQDFEVGKLLFHNHRFRLLIVPLHNNDMIDAVVDKSDDYFTFNFVNAHLVSPIEVGQGSKFSGMRFTMEAYRSPAGATDAGVIWNRDVTGLTTAVEAQNQMIAEQLAEITNQSVKQ